MPFKILHIAPTPFFSDRGCHIRIRGLVTALNAESMENIVCTYPIGEEVSGVETVRTSRIPGYTKTEAGPSPFKYIADILLILTTARQIRKWGPDVLHCHLHEGVLIGWFARLLAFKPRLPLAFDMQGSLTGELSAHGYFAKRTYLRRIFEKIEQRIVKLADLYFCSSQASIDLLVERFDVAAPLVHLVLDGVDLAVDNEDSRGAGNVSENDVTTVVYSGGLTESKGLGTLKAVILETERRNLDARFLVVGYPTDELTGFVEEHGLGGRCSIVGRVPYDKLMQYLRMAEIAIEPKAAGSGEASGKLVNYMAAGLPVVCFDTPNNRLMLGNDGCFAATDDSRAMVDEIEKLLRDTSKARKCGAAGVRRALDRFSWQTGARTIVDGYAFLRDPGLAK